MRAQRFVIGAFVAGMLALAGCGGDDSSATTEAPTSLAPLTEAPADPSASEAPAGGAAATIAIEGFAFSATDGAAGTVEITNADSAAHTVTADDGSFDVSVGGGETASVELTPGTYAFHCEIHGSMKGTIVIS